MQEPPTKNQEKRPKTLLFCRFSSYTQGFSLSAPLSSGFLSKAFCFFKNPLKTV